MSNMELLKYIHSNINEYYNAKEFAKYLGTIDELKGYFMSASEYDIHSFRGIDCLVHDLKSAIQVLSSSSNNVI